MLKLSETVSPFKLLLGRKGKSSTQVNVTFYLDAFVTLHMTTTDVVQVAPSGEIPVSTLYNIYNLDIYSPHICGKLYPLKTIISHYKNLSPDTNVEHQFNVIS